ncbi:MAG: DMT family transporter [Marmoricola sp.]
MSSRSTSAGIAIALLSAATFATAGPFAKSLLETGWTPGSVVFLRIAGASLLLAVPAARALAGNWQLLWRSWRQVVAYGACAVALPQLAFFYAVQHLSVGVALMLEYLALVLVVAWQCLAARRLPQPPTVLGIVLALVGLLLVLDLLPIAGGGQVSVDGVGVLWGLLAAFGLASYFLLSGQSHEASLPPIALAGGGLTVAGVGFAVLGYAGVLPMTFPAADVDLAGFQAPWWAAILELAVFAAAMAYVTGIAAARVLGAKLASFVGLSEVIFAVLFAWLLLAELPRPVQLLGGLFILAGVVVVRSEGRDPGSVAERPVLGSTPLGEGGVVPDHSLENHRLGVVGVESQHAAVETVHDQLPGARAGVAEQVELECGVGEVEALHPAR